MANLLFSNNARSALSGPLTNSATTLTLTAGDGDLFPVVTGLDFFFLTIAETNSNGTEIAWENLKCIARSGDVLTVVRGQEGTTGTAWLSGTPIELRVTAAALEILGNSTYAADDETITGLWDVTNTTGLKVGGTAFTSEDINNWNADHNKLDDIEALADVTDVTNVTAAGALMDSEVTNLVDVKAFSTADYATAAQGTTADAALPKAGGAMTGAITTNSTVDGRDVATDGTKLDGIEASATADQSNAEIRTAVEAATDSNVFTDADHSKLNAIEASATADQTDAEIRTAVEAASDSNVFTDADHTKLNAIEASADVTDATNVTAAGALMDSELTAIASVKALNQGVATGDSPTFAAVTSTGSVTADGGTSANWTTAYGWGNHALQSYATQSYVGTQISNLVDSSPATLNTLNELAAALGDDPNFATTVSASIGTKLPLAGGTMTGAINAGANNISNINNTSSISFLSTNGYWTGGTQRINGSGDLVNIGTISSGAITSTGIDVTGTATISTDLNVGGAVKGNAGTRAVSIGAAGSVIGGLQLWSTTAGTSYVQFGDESGTSANHYRGYMSYNHSTDTLGLGASGSTKVSVNSTGIDVTGTVTATGTSVFASLDISGDIDVDGTTNLDVVDIDGAVNMATTLAVDGTVNMATTLAVQGNVDFNGDLDVDGTIEFDAISGTGSVTVTDILDQDDMSGNSATALATQQSIKAYVDAQQDTVDTLAEILALSNTSSGTNVELTTTDKVQFRDSAIYINSSADGQLDIVADTEIQIAATTIDIDGAINASGEIIAASLDISGDVDVDGTTNLDVVDIDGAVDMASTLQVDGISTFTGQITANGGMEFVDNKKLTFGTGDDLEIYHDGLNSYINDVGTGNIFIRGANVVLTTGGGTKYLEGGSNVLRLYHTGNQRMQTSAAGISVTGSVTADGGNSANWNTAYTVANAALPKAGGTMTGVLTINNTNDLQLNLTSPSSWTGIGFNDSAAMSNDYIWHNGTHGTFAIGGSGSNVANKKLHVNGGMTIGSGYASTAVTANSLNVQGTITATGGNSTNWNTAYGWGNHSSAGYLTSVVASAVNSASATDGYVLTADGAGNAIWELSAGADSANKLPKAGGTMTGTLAMGANAITSTGIISSGAITSTGTLTNTGEVRIVSGAAYNTHLNLNNTGTNIISQANGGVTQIRNSAGTLFTVNSNGTLNVHSGNFQMGGTTVIDASRNISAVNIIPSGYISQATGQSHYFRGGTDANWRIGSDITVDTGGLITQSAIQMIVGGNGNSYGFQIFGHQTPTLPVFEVIPNSVVANSITNIRGKLYIANTEVIDASRNLTNIGTISSGVITATGGNSGQWNTAYTLANAALPKAGGTLTDVVTSNNNILSRNNTIDDETLFAITDQDTTASIVSKFFNQGSGYFTKADDATAPASGVFDVAGAINVNPFGDYIPMDGETEIMFECWAKHISGSDTSGNFYAGGEFYNGSKTSYGNVHRYWGAGGDVQDSDTPNPPRWRHIKGVMKGSVIRAQSNASDAQYVRFLTLFNYNASANTTRFCGFKWTRSKKTVSSLWLKTHNGSANNDSAWQNLESSTTVNIIDNSGNINSPGNITVSGTVDGRNVSTDGTKLDGIATGATNTAAPHYTSAIAVGAGGLTQQNFTTTLKNKLDGIAASANNYTIPSNVVYNSNNFNVTQRMQFSANVTNNWDTIATASGSQGSLEVFNTASGNDAFMAFHAGADYALYFGLDADTNKLAVGGWSMGAVKHAIYHEGNKPSLATLGYTGETNATADQTAAEILAALKTVDVNGTAGVNAGTLDGHALTTASTVSTVVERDSSGDINARLFRSEYDTTNPSIGFIMTQTNTSTNNYMRPSTPAQLRASLNVENGSTADQTAAQIQSLLGINIYNNLTTSTGAGSNLNTIFENNQSGFIDSWSGANLPSGTSHVQGIQARHSSGGEYGFQLANQYNQDKIWHRRITNGGYSTWQHFYTSKTDGSNSGLDADLLDGQEGSYYYAASNPNGYTNDQTAAEIKTLVGNASDSNVFTDADHTKLNGIAASANNYSLPSTVLHSTAYKMTGSGFKLGLHSGAGGTTFAANHYSMGVDVANNGWASPHYSDLIIGYHTGIRIGANYGGTRFYDNSPTTDTNNTGNGDGGETLLMTVGGHAAGTGVKVHQNLIVGTTSSFAGVADFNGGHGGINITSTSILSDRNSTWTGNPGANGKIQYHSARWYIVSDSSSDRIVQFRRDGSDKSYIDNNGTFIGNVSGSSGSCTGNAATATILTAGDKTIAGALIVGNTTHSDIYMVDTNEGNRRIHCNSNRIGFLNSSNAWSAYSTDAGRWDCNLGLTVSNGIINNSAGINYVGTTVTGGTSNAIGFRWIGGPNTVNVGVDNAVNIIIGTASDYRLKIVTTNDIGDSLSRLKSLNTYEYTSKDEDTGTVYRGVLAHEVAKLFPNLVQGAKDDPDQLQSVNHAAFTIELIQAMKQLDARLTAIEAHLNIEAAELVIPDYEPVASPDFVFPVLPEPEAVPTEE